MNKRKLFDTDLLMNNLWQWLVRDCRSMLGDPTFMSEDEAFLTDKPSFRQRQGGRYFLSPYTYFKCRYQMENLFKRYVFRNDLYTLPELERMTINKFVKTQERIGKPEGDLSYRAHLVLQRARKYCREILGPYDVEEHKRLCRFGKRASVGVPRNNAYLDVRLSRPLSGSRAHIDWFKNHLSSDCLLDGILRDLHKGDPQYEECETLTLTNVPKSYKALRSIMPNTTIGGFYTYGLGKMIEMRLRSKGLDLRRLQQKHGRLVRVLSRTRSHVTADLSSASDSFTWAVLNRVLPREWINHLKLGRIRNCRIGNETYHLSSFMTMGIGFTFQVQTLVFYAILKAIQDFSETKGLVSVYGDDLIYPTRMHGYVSQIFQDVGFILNNEKTFVKESFRESCGSDFYCGIDVRPFQPEGQSSLLPRQEYLVLLYKTINGLRKRWEDCEINQTLRFLFSEVLRVSDEILQVPPSFPDYSGVQVDRPMVGYLLPWAAVSRDANLSIVFPFLKLCPRDRYVMYQTCYLWEKLRDPNPEPDFGSSFWEVDWRLFREDSIPVLRWRKAPYQPKNYRSKITGRRLRKLQASLPRIDGSYSIIRQTSTTCVWN